MLKCAYTVAIMFYDWYNSAMIHAQTDAQIVILFLFKARMECIEHEGTNWGDSRVIWAPYIRKDEEKIPFAAGYRD